MNKRAIISVSDKSGIKELAQGLIALGWEIISTGGTAKYLAENGIKVTPVSDVTKFPEIMDGRVKTLHPAILAAILADQSNHSHLEQLGQLEIRSIDLVVVNLYPFEETIIRHSDPEPVEGEESPANAGPHTREILRPASPEREQGGQAQDDKEAIENIDIGGPTMLRAAAKNFHSVTVIVDPNDYIGVLEELKKGDVSLKTRKRLATKVFAHTAKYDGAIANYFSTSLRANAGSVAIPTDEIASASPRNDFPDVFTLSFEKVSDLRYGENPHQKAAFYKDYRHSGAEQSGAIESRSYPITSFQDPSASRMTAGRNITDAQVLQGKELSFNNILDADAALNLIQEFDEPVCAIIKHNNPCGVAISPCHSGPWSPQAIGDRISHECGPQYINDAFTRAWSADPLSAFGGIVALNRPCTREIAEALSKVFIEIVLAPDFLPESLELFKSKPNLRLLKLNYHPELCHPEPSRRTDEARHPELVSGSRNKQKDFKRVSGGLLVQDKDESVVTEKDLKVVTKKHPSPEELRDMLFAWKVAKHCKSNAIVLARNGVTVGLGLGQTSRVGSVKIAITQTKNVTLSRVEGLKNRETDKLTCASDAFFPFRDSVDELARAGVTAIIQPGGSKNDGEVISAADEHKLSMTFTGIRVFRH